MNCSFVDVNISSSAHNLFGIQLNMYVINNQAYFRHIIAIFDFTVVRFHDLAYSVVALEFSKRLLIFQLNFSCRSLFYA
jgi:hypothetical protein